MDNEQGEVKRSQAGDRAAFDRLACHYRAWLLAMAFMRTSDREAAEDLVQEVLARAWGKLSEIGNPGAFAGWLQRIMVNACYSWYRSRIR